jgi:pimeloyl-ACP methyl ester carboxylesterase
MSPTTSIPFTRSSVPTSRGEISYLDAGSGPVAVFVHGVLMNAWLWRLPILELAGERRCIAPDLLGHGDTRCRDDQQDLSFGSQADMLAELIDQLRCGPVDLVGNDSGGAICQILAARRPDLVRTMTLTNCDTADNVFPEPLLPFVQLCRDGGALDLFAQMAADLGTARAVLAVTLQDAEALPDDTLLRFVEPLARNERRERSIQRWMHDLTDRDLRIAEAALATTRVPTAVVWGDDDRFFPLADAQRLVDLIPTATGPVVLAGARLFLPLERAPELAAAIRDLWRVVTPTK